MARRASSNSSPAVIAAVVVGVAALAGGAFFVFSGDKSEIEKSTPGPVDQFIDSGGRQFREGEYRFTGTLDNRFTRGEKEFAAVLVENEQKSQRPIFIEIPVEAKEGINLERNSDYAFLVEVDKTGFPIARQIETR